MQPRATGSLLGALHAGDIARQWRHPAATAPPQHGAQQQIRAVSRYFTAAVEG